MHAGPVWLLFGQLSTPDSRQLRHLEVSHWHGYVRASVKRFFINPQGDLYPTKDGIQYNVDKQGILKRLIPLIRRNFATAPWNADQMGPREQETMDLILAHERKLEAEHPCQCDPRLHGRDEVNSHADSPRAAAPAPSRIKCDGDTSPEPRPSTSTVSPGIISSATMTNEEGLIIPVPKLKCKSAMKRGSKKSKPLPDSEPNVVPVTRVLTKRSKNDACPPLGGSEPVVINTDNDSDDTKEWQT